MTARVTAVNSNMMSDDDVHQMGMLTWCFLRDVCYKAANLEKKKKTNSVTLFSKGL